MHVGALAIQKRAVRAVVGKPAGCYGGVLSRFWTVRCTKLPRLDCCSFRSQPRLAKKPSRKIETEDPPHIRRRGKLHALGSSGVRLGHWPQALTPAVLAQKSVEPSTVSAPTVSLCFSHGCSRKSIVGREFAFFPLWRGVSKAAGRAADQGEDGFHNTRIFRLLIFDSLGLVPPVGLLSSFGALSRLPLQLARSLLRWEHVTANRNAAVSLPVPHMVLMRYPANRH